MTEKDKICVGEFYLWHWSAWSGKLPVMFFQLETIEIGSLSSWEVIICTTENSVGGLNIGFLDRHKIRYSSYSNCIYLLWKYIKGYISRGFRNHVRFSRDGSMVI